MSPASFLKLLHRLPAMPELCNPWMDTHPGLDTGPDAPTVRSHNLERYLARRVGKTRLLFVGEAPGFLGARWSGIAMTSERILLGGKPGVPASSVFDGEVQRTSDPARFPSGANEMTATIAWGLLLGDGLDPDSFAFWNALPVHPHKPGNPLSNRAPKPAELQACSHVLPAMLELLETAKPIAVGNVAQKALKKLGIDAPQVRHPAMGGANAFREQVRALL